MRRRFTIQLLLPALLSPVLLESCHHSSSNHHDAVDQVFESEPNDFVDEANVFGGLRAGDTVFINGSVSDFGSDQIDGFAFFSEEPALVDVVLRIDNPYADLDVCVYDPVADVFVDCFETVLSPETGRFEMLGGGGEFHLVVSSFAETSSYTLEVYARCCGLPAAALEAPRLSATSERGLIERLDAYRNRQAEPSEEDLSEADTAYGRLIAIDDKGEIHIEDGLVLLPGGS